MLRYLLALASLALGACSSGGSDSGGGAGTCEAAYRAHCKRACECEPGPACVFAPGVVKTDAGTTVFVGTIVASEEACLSFVTTECANGGDPKGDYPTCEQKSATAACIPVTDNDGGTHTGVEPLAECDFN